MTAGLVLQFLLVLFKELVPRLWDLFKENPEQFIADSHEVFSYAKRAQTPTDKQEAIKKLQDLLRGIK